jgi:hypothetical protein
VPILNPVDQIAFVIATHEYGAGQADGVEPVIDGVSVVDLFARVDGESSYAGLAPPEPVLQRWQSLLAAGEADRMQLLGCGCGDDLCRWAAAQIEVRQDTVVWSDFWGSSPVGEPGPGRYHELGPYQFERAQYAAALATPVRAEAPIREKLDTAALRAGIPSDPRAWLKEMTLAFGRDFHAPSQPDSTQHVAAEGLRALTKAGHPMTDEVVREWARNRRYAEEGIARCVERFREIGRLS